MAIGDPNPGWTLDLEAGEPIIITDPNMAMIAETQYGPVDGSNPTSGPNRYTVFVPFHNTTMSMGRAASRWINDNGFTVRTDEHVHLQVSAQVPTIVSLGKSATSATDVTAQDDAVPTTSNGYSMVTAGNAWQDAAGQFVSIAGGHILVRTTGAGTAAAPIAAVLQSDHGVAEVVGGKGATVAAAKKVVISADSGQSIPNTPYDGEHTLSVSKFMGSKVAKSVLTAADVIASGYAIWKALPATSAAAHADTASWEEDPTRSMAKIIVDSAKLVSTLIREADGYAEFSGASKVGVQSSGYASMMGGISASVHGHLSGSVSSLLSASVLGGTASVKGVVYTSIWACKETSVKATFDVKIEGEKGKGSLKGKKKVEVISKEGPAIIQAKNEAQVVSMDKGASLYGKTGFMAGGGSSSGYGVAGGSSGVRIGKVTSFSKFSDVVNKFDSNNVLDFTDSVIKMKKDDSEIVLRSNHLNIGHGSSNHIQITSSNVILDGSKLLLG